MQIPVNPYVWIPGAAPVTPEVIEDFALAACECAMLTSNAIAATPTPEQADLSWQRLCRCLRVAAKWPESHKLYLALVQHPARATVIPRVIVALDVDEKAAAEGFDSLVGGMVKMVYELLAVTFTARTTQNRHDTLSKGKGKGRFGVLLMKAAK